MGHTRLGWLPRTYRWKHVISLLEAGADLSVLANASLRASLTALKTIPADPGYNIVLTNVFKFAEAARAKDFAHALQSAGFDVSPSGMLLDLAGALRSKCDHDLARHAARSDVSEIAQNAFHEVLLESASSSQFSLLEATPQDVHQSIARELKGRGFSELMHAFYSVFTRRYLGYYLSRELSNHVGVGKYFKNTASHQQFDSALDLYIRQTVRIADEFTPGWLGKTIWKDELDGDSVERYSHAAFNKIVSEFKRGAERSE